MPASREFTRGEVVDLASALANLRIDLGIIDNLLLQTIGMNWSEYTSYACDWEMRTVNTQTNAAGRALAQLLSEEAKKLAK